MLLCFEQAARLTSFKLAAQALSLTPSAVSHSIQELENLLGVRLFDRGTRTIALTADGKIYLEACRESLSILTDAGERLRRDNDEGEINVSASPFFSGTVLIPAMMRFEKEFPDYRLNIQTSNTFADLKNRQIDIAIRISRSKEAGTKRFHLLDVSSIPICPVQYLKGRRAIRRVEDFNQFPLIEVSFLKRAWPEWFADQGLEMPEFEKTIDMDTTVGIVDAVRNGVGIGLGIYPLVSRLSGYGTEFVAPFDLPGKVRTGFSAVVRKEIASQRKIVRFLDWLKEELQITFGQ